MIRLILILTFLFPTVNAGKLDLRIAQIRKMYRQIEAQSKDQELLYRKKEEFDGYVVSQAAIYTDEKGGCASSIVRVAQGTVSVRGITTTGRMGRSFSAMFTGAMSMDAGARFAAISIRRASSSSASEKMPKSVRRCGFIR